MNVERTRARLTDSMLASSQVGPLFQAAATVIADELGPTTVVVFCDAVDLEVVAASAGPPILQRLSPEVVLLDGRPATFLEMPGGTSRALCVHPPLADIAELELIATTVAALEGHARRMESLVGSEERFRMAQELAKFGSYDWEIETDQNTWSDELYRIYGTEPGSFNPSYQTFLSFIHPDDRERVQAVHHLAYDSGRPYSMEERIVRPDGTVRTLESNGVVLRDESGKPVRMTGICWDITDLKEAERIKARLEEAEEARRRSLEINDAIVQRLSLASNALEHGGLREGIRYVHDSLVEARRIAGEMLEQASDNGRDLRVLTRFEAAAVSSTPAAVDDRGDSDAVRVLVADDTPGMRLLIREYLTSGNGFRVVGEASTGFEALALAQDLKPDLIVLDLSMPELDGMQTIPELRRLVPDAAILVMSGYGGPMVERALAAGAGSYVEKGTGFGDLVARARELVGLVRTG